MEMSEEFYRAVERRIEWLTAVVGAKAAVWAGIRWGWRFALGLALGAVIAWLNFRWLERGVSALLASVAARAGSVEPRVSRWVYAALVGRMALLVAALCVILKSGWLPGVAILAGLFSLIAGVLIEVSYEVVSGFRERDSGSGEASSGNGHRTPRIQ